MSLSISSNMFCNITEALAPIKFHGGLQIVSATLHIKILWTLESFVNDIKEVMWLQLVSAIFFAARV